MVVFVDTSALYALVNAADVNHSAASDYWDSLAQQPEPLITSNYVLLETAALLGRRFGLSAVRDFPSRLTPLLEVHWVDEALHNRAMAALLTAGQRDLSLVDCVSFELMRQLGLDTAFTFDAHFAQQGLRPVP